MIKENSLHLCDSAIKREPTAWKHNDDDDDDHDDGTTLMIGNFISTIMIPMRVSTSIDIDAELLLIALILLLYYHYYLWNVSMNGDWEPGSDGRETLDGHLRSIESCRGRSSWRRTMITWNGNDNNRTQAERKKSCADSMSDFRQHKALRTEMTSTLGDIAEWRTDLSCRQGLLGLVGAWHESCPYKKRVGHLTRKREYLKPSSSTTA